MKVFAIFVLSLVVILGVSYGLSAGGFAAGPLDPWVFQTVWPVLFVLQSVALTRLICAKESSATFALVIGILLGWLWLVCRDSGSFSFLILVLMTISFFISTALMIHRDPVVSVCLIPTVVWLCMVNGKQKCVG